MAATNLYFARHMDGSRVREDQIKVGLEIMASSPTGGIFRYVCQSRNDEVAFFKNTNPDWPLWSDLVVQFYQKDLSALDFEFVLAGVNGMDYGNFLPNQYLPSVSNHNLLKLTPTLFKGDYLANFRLKKHSCASPETYVSMIQGNCVFRSIPNSHFGMTRTPISV